MSYLLTVFLCKTEDSNTSSTSPLENQEAQQRMRNESRGFSLTWDEMNENEVHYKILIHLKGIFL